MCHNREIFFPGDLFKGIYLPEYFFCIPSTSKYRKEGFEVNSFHHILTNIYITCFFYFFIKNNYSKNIVQQINN